MGISIPGADRLSSNTFRSPWLALTRILRWSLPLVLLALLMPVVPALADHGSFWHHNGHIWDPSPSQYYAYAHTYAEDWTDYLGAHIRVKRNGAVVKQYSVSCGFAQEGCSSVQTPTAAWSQGGSHEVKTYHCGDDYPHYIPGDTNDPVGVCFGYDRHAHLYSWSD
jgi:hypothetical protein